MAPTAHVTFDSLSLWMVHWMHGNNKGSVKQGGARDYQQQLFRRFVYLEG